MQLYLTILVLLFNVSSYLKAVIVKFNYIHIATFTFG